MWLTTDRLDMAPAYRCACNHLSLFCDFEFDMFIYVWMSCGGVGSRELSFRGECAARGLRPA